MNIFALKSLFALAILAIALLGVSLPLYTRLKSQSQALLFYGQFFARGIFIGAAFIHLLPEALSHMAEALPNLTYPLVFTLCALTIFMVQFIEQGVIQFCHFNKREPIQWIPFLLMTLLSVHSLIEGAALGLSDTLGGVLIIFIAIIAHKGAEAFALGISMRAANIRAKAVFRIMIIFALMTPLGIALGAAFDFYARNGVAILGEGIFNAIAAGTFIYIATFQHSEMEVDESLHSSLSEILYFGLGIVVMAVIAIWL